MYRHLLALAALLLIATLAVAPARSTPLYTVQFGDANSVSSSTEMRRDTTYAIYTSNGSGDFVGAGYAGPGRVCAFQRLDALWAGVFSGGNQYICNARAQATDFVVSGPGTSVVGTLHFRASADLSLGGGYADNNAHETNFYVRADITGYGNNYGTVLGNMLIGNHAPQSSGCFAGMTSPHIDVPVDLTLGLPVNAPLNLIIFTQADGATYGNINVSPGFAETNAGGDGTDTIRGFRLDGSSGVVMTLPAGYSLDVPSWGVLNNTYSVLTGVDQVPATGEFRLELAGANPTTRDSRLSFSLAQGGIAHVIVFDVAGRRVRTLVNGWQTAGTHSLAWDGREEGGAMAPAGIYFVRADADGKRSTTRIVRMH